ncbi:hypothetical protein IAR55_000692 [Kwoniella newhampshirensis]|uniref:Cytochrome P450 n=1 Tax=Kwoniella newhampshirensis TaxID=1651941 RepID=A0AAW0Z7C4_9TREE
MYTDPLSVQSLLHAGVFAALACVSAVFYYYVYREYSSTVRGLRGPPPAHWLYGSQPSLQDAPNGSLQTQWFETYGPTLRYYSLRREQTILTMDPVAVSYIHSHPTLFEQSDATTKFSQQVMGPSLTAALGPDHRRQRRAIAPSFNTPQLRIMAPVFIDKANQLVERILDDQKAQGGDHVDLQKYIGQLTVDVIGLAGFDLDFDTLGKGGHELLAAWKRQMEGSFDSTFSVLLQNLGFPVPMFLRSERSKGIDEASRVMKRIGNRLLADKRKAIQAEMGDSVTKSDFAGGDLITNLLRANMAVDVKADQRMSDEEVLAQIPLFLFAGNTTIAVTLTWCVGLLAKHPDVQNKLRKEVSSIESSLPAWEIIDALPYLDAVVHEVLRLYPAAPTLFRVAQADTVIPLQMPVVGRSGRCIEAVPIKKGNTVHIAFGQMNLDKGVWGLDADEFRPSRFLLPDNVRSRLIGNIHTFGGGSRHCIGAKFAIAEIKTVLFVLVRRLSFEETSSKPEFTRHGGHVAKLGLARAKVGGRLEMPLRVEKAE